MTQGFKLFLINTMKLTRPCAGIFIIVLSACSVINFLITVAAILLSTGVVDVSADFVRMSLAVTCDGERVSVAGSRSPNAAHTLLF